MQIKGSKYTIFGTHQCAIKNRGPETQREGVSYEQPLLEQGIYIY
jgi:hypothetical protein